MNNQSPFSTKGYQGIQPPTVTEYSKGISLRDYFAAKAMQAVLTNHKLEDCDDDVVAKNCYQMADFMLKARTE